MSINDDFPPSIINVLNEKQDVENTNKKMVTEVHFEYNDTPIVSVIENDKPGNLDDLANIFHQLGHTSQLLCGQSALALVEVFTKVLKGLVRLYS